MSAIKASALQPLGTWYTQRKEGRASKSQHLLSVASCSLPAFRTWHSGHPEMEKVAGRRMFATFK